MSGERERRLLEIARRHFERYGYKKTVIDEIVQEAGIAKGTFYLHFKSKKELLSRVVKMITDEVEAEFREEMAKVAGQPAEMVRMMVRFSLEVMERHPILVKLLADEPETQFFREFANLPERKEEEQATVEMVRGVLAMGVEMGEFREDIDMQVTPFLLGALKAIYFYREFLVGEGMLTLDELIHGLADMAVNSLLKRPSPEGDDASV